MESIVDLERDTFENVHLSALRDAERFALSNLVEDYSSKNLDYITRGKCYIASLHVLRYLVKYHKDEFMNFYTFTGSSGLTYFAQKHVVACVEDRSSNFYLISPANSANIDGTLPQFDGKNIDRTSCVFVSKSIEEAIAQIKKFEGGNVWNIEKHSPISLLIRY